MTLIGVYRLQNIFNLCFFLIIKLFEAKYELLLLEDPFNKVRNWQKWRAGRRRFKLTFQLQAWLSSVCPRCLTIANLTPLCVLDALQAWESGGRAQASLDYTDLKTDRCSHQLILILIHKTPVQCSAVQCTTLHCSVQTTTSTGIHCNVERKIHQIRRFCYKIFVCFHIAEVSNDTCKSLKSRIYNF